MTTEQIEDAIVSRLKSSIPDLEVSPFPERPDEYGLIHPVGAVLVQYRGSEYSEPASLGTITQTRTMEFVVLLAVRHLRSHQGAYAYLDSIRGSLTGYVIPPLSKMFAVREAFLAEKGGIWWYAVEFKARSIETEP